MSPTNKPAHIMRQENESAGKEGCGNSVRQMRNDLQHSSQAERTESEMHGFTILENYSRDQQGENYEEYIDTNRTAE